MMKILRWTAVLSLSSVVLHTAAPDFISRKGDITQRVVFSVSARSESAWVAQVETAAGRSVAATERDACQAL